MLHTSPAEPGRRSRRIRALTITASTGLLLAALPAGVAAAGGHRTWVVHPGQSIQAAVDRAGSGDTIQIDAGTYQEGVCVDRKGLTVVGAGRDKTKIVWPRWTTAADLPHVAPTPCWQAEDRANATSDHSTLADDVSGLFFLDPASPVEVRGLSTSNHPANGIVAWGADGFRVSKTKGSGHGRFGILAADSKHSRITRNVEVGTDRGTPEEPRSGTAGIAVTDSATAYGYVASNDVEGYNIGVLAHEARSGSVTNNYLSGNCMGLMVLDDAATSVPDASRNVAAGDWQVNSNDVRANDRFCLGGIGEVGEQLRVSGTGITLVNADRVDVRDNLIRDNKPSVDPKSLDLPAAGLALISLPPFAGPDGVQHGPVENIQVSGNSLGRNVPVDVLLSSPQMGPHMRDVGTGIQIHGNNCRSSIPPQVCAP
jgi:Right handed beta helix region